MAITDPASRSNRDALTESVICAWLGAAAPGDRLAYHRGFLAIDTTPDRSGGKSREHTELLRVASRASLLSEQGLVHLLQQRHGHDDYTYWMVARARPRVHGGALERVLGQGSSKTTPRLG